MIQVSGMEGVIVQKESEMVTKVSEMNDPQRLDDESLDKARIEAQAFIGFAVVDLTKEPWNSMEPGPWNRRDVNEVEVGKLETSLKDEGVLRVRHPMTVTASRGDLVEGTYIDTVPGEGKLPHLGVKEGGIVLLLAGQHRRAALAKYRHEVEKLVESLLHDKMFLSKLPEDATEGMREGLALDTEPAPRSVAEAEQRLAEARRLCEGLKQWNVRIYDKGTQYGDVGIGRTDCLMVNRTATGPRDVGVLCGDGSGEQPAALPVHANGGGTVSWGVDYLGGRESAVGEANRECATLCRTRQDAAAAVRGPSMHGDVGAGQPIPGVVDDDGSVSASVADSDDSVASIWGECRVSE
jgi:hypothetical protein